MALQYGQEEGRKEAAKSGKECRALAGDVPWFPSEEGEGQAAQELYGNENIIMFDTIPSILFCNSIEYLF